MKKRKIISIVLFIIGASLSVAFISKIQFPQGFQSYFNIEYYSQFSALLISVELLIASYYLLVGHKKTNFALAVFGSTGLLDALLNQLGVFRNSIPLYGIIILSLCAIYSLWLAYKNPFQLKPISHLLTILSVILSIVTELFFNYLQ